MTDLPPTELQSLDFDLPSRSARWRAKLSPVLAALCVLAIFALHTYWNNRIAIAVLYVAVVLLAVNFCGRRGVIAVGFGCALLPILSFLISDGPIYSADSIGRSAVSLLAIGITTFLVVQIQAAAQRTQNQARLLDLSHDAILVRGMTDAIIYWNRGAEELYGWSQVDARGQISHQMLETEFPAMREKTFATLLRNGRWEGELVQTRRDGTQAIVASRWSLQKDERGTPTAILQIDTDITASRQAQDTLERAEAELAHVARIATLGELTTTIAHEVNQPLTGIVTNGEACLRWLDRDEIDIDEVTDTLKRIVRDGRRAGDVIQRLRTLSQKAEPQRMPLEINDIVTDAVSLLQREIDARHVSLKLDLLPHLPIVKADRVQLQQVLINLVMNAMQAMQTSAPRVIEIRTSFEDNEVLIAIVDSGCGIANVEAQLFHAFFTTKSDGIGMGLSICRSIIEAHGGRIWPSRNEDSGSTFQFTLPVYQRGGA